LIAPQLEFSTLVAQSIPTLHSHSTSQITLSFDPGQTGVAAVP
jgi:hypothetical protein